MNEIGCNLMVCVFCEGLIMYVKLGVCEGRVEGGEMLESGWGEKGGGMGCCWLKM